MAVAGLLGATEGEMGFSTGGRGINIDYSRVQVLNGAEGAVNIPRINGGGQAIGYAVSNFNPLLEAVDRDHRNHRAKDFFLSDAMAGSQSPKTVASWNQPLEYSAESRRWPPARSFAPSF